MEITENSEDRLVLHSPRQLLALALAFGGFGIALIASGIFRILFIPEADPLVTPIFFFFGILVLVFFAMGEWEASNVTLTLDSHSGTGEVTHVRRFNRVSSETFSLDDIKEVIHVEEINEGALYWIAFDLGKAGKISASKSVSDGEISGKVEKQIRHWLKDHGYR